MSIEPPSLLERVTVLETEIAQVNKDCSDIKLKLDELLQLKDKGLGALWLIGIILLFGSGIMAFAANVVSTFGKPHI